MAEITNDLGTFPVPYYTRSQRLLPITKVTREKIVREIVKKYMIRSVLNRKWSVNMK